MGDEHLAVIAPEGKATGHGEQVILTPPHSSHDQPLRELSRGEGRHAGRDLAGDGARPVAVGQGSLCASTLRPPRHGSEGPGLDPRTRDPGPLRVRADQVVAQMGDPGRGAPARVPRGDACRADPGVGHADFTLTDSHSICDYINGELGGFRLLAREGAARWRALADMPIACGIIEAQVARRAELLRSGSERSDDSSARCGTASSGASAPWRSGWRISARLRSGPDHDRRRLRLRRLAIQATNGAASPRSWRPGTTHRSGRRWGDPAGRNTAG